MEDTQRTAGPPTTNFTTANGQYGGTIGDLDLGENCCGCSYGVAGFDKLAQKIQQACSVFAGGYLNATEGALPQGNLTGACFNDRPTSSRA